MSSRAGTPSTTAKWRKHLGLFGRNKPLHRQLADAGGLTDVDGDEPARGLPTQPPGWDGQQRGEPGIHGISRARRWDAVATIEAPDLHGDAARFVALPDGTLLDESEEPATALQPLADAVEATLSPPYRAEAVRRSPTMWAAAARRIVVVSEPGLIGDEAELVVSAGDRTLQVDGEQRVPRAPGLEAAGERLGSEFVVRAARLDGELWEVEAAAL